jgi:two-component system cell cycle response regulator
MSARILIVDDVVAAVKMLSAKLAAEYYDVLTALDGLNALKLAERDDPDLVLLDVMMPGMDGFEICRRIKENPVTTHIPVVMVTALNDQVDRVRGLDAGADDFLSKPISDVVLFSRVRSMVRLKRTCDQWRLREETTQKLGFLPEQTVVHIESGRDGRVMVIDESRIEATTIKTILAEDHDEVIVADLAGGTSVETAAESGDVIIVSLSAGSDTPLRLAARLRATEATRHLPILLIGEEEDSGRLIKALELGANDYVFRPIDSQELKARVRTQIRRKRYHDRLRANFLHNLSLALTDDLTGLHNRRFFDSHLDTAMRRMSENNKPLSLLMIDIDHFKTINDTHGHAAGDEILREVAQRLARNVRGIDLAARYGGEEFVVVMPDTSLEVAVSVAERLCGKMAGSPVVAASAGTPISTTLSVGAAQSAGPMDTAQALLRRADAALYGAKNGGRNQVRPRYADIVPAVSERRTP